MWLTQRGEEKGKLWGKRYFPPFFPLISQEEKHIRLAILISIAFKKLDLCNEYLPGRMPAAHWQPACLGAEGVHFPLSLSLSPCYVWCKGSLRWGEGHFCGFLWVPVTLCGVLGCCLSPGELSCHHHTFVSLCPTCLWGEAVVPLDARLKLPLRAKLWPYSLCRWPKVSASHWGHPCSPAIPSYGGHCPTPSWGTQAGPSSKEASKTCGYRIWQKLRERPESGRKNEWVFSRQNRGKSNK